MPDAEIVILGKGGRGFDLLSHNSCKEKYKDLVLVSPLHATASKSCIGDM